MSLPFDATLKDLVQTYPRDWLVSLGLPADGPVTPLNVDLSTLSAAADVVLGLGDPLTSLVDLEFQSSRDADLSRRVLVYNTLLHQRFRLPVHSVVVLLRRTAEDAGLDGTVRYGADPGRGGLEFRFEVVRLWQRPAEELLAGSLGTLPLAMLGAPPEGLTTAEALPAVLRRLEDRIRAETTPPATAKLLTAAFIMTGMRLDPDAAANLFRGVQGMEESTTYQLIMRQGAARYARSVISRQGRKRFGPPDTAAEAAVQAVEDLDRLDRMIERLPEATGWPDLLETP
jgi:hypothetical protein